MVSQQARGGASPHSTMTAMCLARSVKLLSRIVPAGDHWQETLSGGILRARVVSARSSEDSRKVAELLPRIACSPNTAFLEFLSCSKVEHSSSSSRPSNDDGAAPKRGTQDGLS